MLDRAVDLLSPACTQLTYEGLIDEVFGVTNGAVMLDPGGCAGAPCCSGLASCTTRAGHLTRHLTPQPGTSGLVVLLQAALSSRACVFAPGAHLGRPHGL